MKSPARTEPEVCHQVLDARNEPPQLCGWQSVDDGPTEIAPCGGQDVTISVPLVTLDPAICHRQIYPSLKITVANLKELMAPENPAGSYVVSGEDGNNLPRRPILNGHGPLPLFGEA
jgi:hypothetical protein